MTGTGSDGSVGVKAIKKMGGTVIVQDEKSSEYFGMPRASVEAADFMLPLEEIAPALMTLIVKGDLE
jgi:two-component system chemotaxis response regulator CheB